jgi:DNA polymerase zeta
MDTFGIFMFEKGCQKTMRNFMGKREEKGRIVHVIGWNVTYFEVEQLMIEKFALLVARIDPDMLVGYEVNRGSWGYLIDRYARLTRTYPSILFLLPASIKSSYTCQGKDFCRLLSRYVVSKGWFKEAKPGDEDKLNWSFRKTSGVEVGGRVVLNVWRLIKSDLPLTYFSFQNVVFHVLHERVPRFQTKDLSDWYKVPRTRGRTIRYVIDRVTKTLDLLDETNMIGRTR